MCRQVHGDPRPHRQEADGSLHAGPRGSAETTAGSHSRRVGDKTEMIYVEIFFHVSFVIVDIVCGICACVSCSGNRDAMHAQLQN